MAVPRETAKNFHDPPHSLGEARPQRGRASWRLRLRQGRRTAAARTNVVEDLPIAVMPAWLFVSGSCCCCAEMLVHVEPNRCELGPDFAQLRVTGVRRPRFGWRGGRYVTAL